MITDTQAVTLLMQLREARAELAEQTAQMHSMGTALADQAELVEGLNERVVKIRQALLYAIAAETEPAKECAP